MHASYISRTSAFLVTLLVTLTYFVPFVASLCCPCSLQLGTGTSNWPWGCCATGPCNIACCNCDGHCKGGFAANDGFEVFRGDTGNESLDCSAMLMKIDTNNDGLIDKKEWFNWVQRERDGDEGMLIRFNLFDITGRGFITMNEAMSPQPVASRVHAQHY